MGTDQVPEGLPEETGTVPPAKPSEVRSKAAKFKGTVEPDYSQFTGFQGWSPRGSVRAQSTGDGSKARFATGGLWPEEFSTTGCRASVREDAVVPLSSCSSRSSSSTDERSRATYSAPRRSRSRNCFSTRISSIRDFWRSSDKWTRRFCNWSRVFSQDDHFCSETNRLQEEPRAAHSLQEFEIFKRTQGRFAFEHAEQGSITSRPDRSMRPPIEDRKSAEDFALGIARKSGKRTDRQIAGTRRPFIPSRSTRVSATTRAHADDFEDEAREGEGACYEQPVELLFTARQYCRMQNRLSSEDRRATQEPGNGHGHVIIPLLRMTTWAFR